MKLEKNHDNVNIIVQEQHYLHEKTIKDPYQNMYTYTEMKTFESFLFNIGLR